MLENFCHKIRHKKEDGEVEKASGSTHEPAFCIEPMKDKQLNVSIELN